MGTVALRTSLIWHDEVMADLVHERPTPITIGASSEATLLTPDLRLPADFAIVRPGHRGYLLTLGDRMRGTISVGGVEHDVAAFVRAADEASEFRATPIGGSDWGVIELDESGDCKLFFQFVPLDEPTWNVSGPILDGESRASLAFSVMLHLAILLVTFKLADGSEPFVWPGPKAATGSYIVTRLDVEPPPEPTVTQTEGPKPGALAPTVPDGPPVAKQFPPTRGTFQRPDKRPSKPADADDDDSDGDDGEPPVAKGPAAGAGVMQFEDVLRGVRDRELSNAIKKHKQMNGKPGKPGAGLGVGPAGGPRDGGNGKKTGPLGDETKGGELKTGPIRDAVCIGSACGGGTPMILTLPPDQADNEPTITKDDIDRVMKKNQGLFRGCYQRALDRDGPNSRALDGDLIVRFTINADGKVTGARSSGGSLTGTDVASCVSSKITLLKFPARGGAIVNYPFMFTSFR